MINFDYTYEKSRWEENKIEHFLDKKLGYRLIENGTILPTRGENWGGIEDEYHNFIGESAAKKCFNDGYSYEQNEVNYRDESAIFLGVFIGAWGHCITDNLSRVWFLYSEQFREYLEHNNECKLVFIPVEYKTISDSFIKLLDIVGVKFEQLVPITEITRFREIVLPDESFFSIDGTERYFTKEYTETIDRVREYARDHYVKLPFNKVYFTYSSFIDGKVYGEDILEQFFKEQGYTIIAPEKYSFEEQLNILVNCAHFASTDGSCGHNMIFLNDRTHVTLIPRAWYLTFYQSALNEVGDKDIYYVDCNMSVVTSTESLNHGPFFYYVSEKLEDYFGVVKSTDLKDKIGKAFVVYRSTGRISNRKLQIPDEYKNRMNAFINEYTQFLLIKIILIKIKRKLKGIFRGRLNDNL